MHLAIASMSLQNNVHRLRFLMISDMYNMDLLMIIFSGYKLLWYL